MQFDWTVLEIHIYSIQQKKLQVWLAFLHDLTYAIDEFFKKIEPAINSFAKEF